VNRADIETRYRAMDDGELAALAAQPDELTTDAQASLARELASRRINLSKLSDELREEVRARNGRERLWNPGAIYSFVPGSKVLVAKIKDWRTYKRQTGQYPILSIVAYAFHVAIALFIFVGLVWYAVGHHWSRWGLAGAFLFLASVEGYLSDRLLGEMRLREIARYRSRRRSQR
jgi:hypothetical protein